MLFSFSIYYSSTIMVASQLVFYNTAESQIIVPNANVNKYFRLRNGAIDVEKSCKVCRG